MKKNVASQKWRVFAWDTGNTVGKTGDSANITADIDKDFAGEVATSDTNPTEVGTGYYDFALSQAETNADHLALRPVSVTGNIVVVACPPVILTSNPNAIQTKTDLIPASPTSVSDIVTSATIADAIWDEVLSDHTSASTAGSDLGIVVAIPAIQAKTDLIPASPASVSDVTSATSDAIADAVWNEALSGHTGAGTTGSDLGIVVAIPTIQAKTDLIPASPASVSDIVTSATIADAVWDEVLSDHTSAGTAGSDLGIVVAIPAVQAKTDLIPASPASVSDIVTSATSDAIADAVWNEVLSGHTGAGTTGSDLGIVVAIPAIQAKTDLTPASPTSVSDIVTSTTIADAVWDEVLSDHTSANTAGSDLGIVVAIPAVQAKTDLIPASPASVSDIVTSATSDAIADAVWNEVLSGHTSAGTTGSDLGIVAAIPAIQAKTDLIPAIPASVSDIVTSNAIADAIWDEVLSGHTGAGTTGSDLGIVVAIPTIQAKTDLIPASPASTSDAATSDAIADAVWDEALSGHVEAGSSGSDLGIVTAIPAISTSTSRIPTSPSSVSDATSATSDAIADAVWDELLAGHNVANTTGANQNLIDDIEGEAAPTSDAIADAVWNEALSGHTTSTTMGGNVNLIDNIKAKTDLITSTGTVAISADAAFLQVKVGDTEDWTFLASDVGGTTITNLDNAVSVQFQMRSQEGGGQTYFVRNTAGTNSDLISATNSDITITPTATDWAAFSDWYGIFVGEFKITESDSTIRYSPDVLFNVQEVVI